MPGYDGVKISGTWDLVAWIFASAPFLAVPAAAIHSFQVEEGSVKKVKWELCKTCCSISVNRKDNEVPTYQVPHNRWVKLDFTRVTVFFFNSCLLYCRKSTFKERVFLVRSFCILDNFACFFCRLWIFF